MEGRCLSADCSPEGVVALQIEFVFHVGVNLRVNNIRLGPGEILKDLLFRVVID